MGIGYLRWASTGARNCRTCLREFVQDYRTSSNGVRLYYELLEQDIKCITVDEVERRNGRRLNMISMFKGLCVLEKQTAVPKRVLRHFWSMDNTCTNVVMKKFTNCNLVSRVETDVSTHQESDLQLNDLVLLRCQKWQSTRAESSTSELLTRIANNSATATLKRKTKLRKSGPGGMQTMMVTFSRIYQGI